MRKLNRGAAALLLSGCFEGAGPLDPPVLGTADAGALGLGPQDLPDRLVQQGGRAGSPRVRPVPRRARRPRHWRPRRPSQPA